MQERKSDVGYENIATSRDGAAFVITFNRPKR